MDVATFKNVSFALFTFFPIIMVSFITCLFGFLHSKLVKKNINFLLIIKLGFKATFFQFLLLAITTLVLYLFYLNGSINFIPLILLLPLSTIISIVLFFIFLFKRTGGLYT
ncbi:hypothetical protein N480_03585 [Pseudoalteromonas luteoviolacea S2607]|nr:hypothetical protein N480_03585 [Pseudoalteromonas luteoviolacea S2607]